MEPDWKDEQFLSDEKAVSHEIEHYRDVLNNLVGLFAFGLGYACIGFGKPSLAAVIGFPVIFALILYARKHFPPIITTFRRLLTEGKNDPQVEFVRYQSAYFEKKHFGLKSVFTRYFIFVWGLLFYILIMVWPDFVTFLKNP